PPCAASSVVGDPITSKLARRQPTRHAATSAACSRGSSVSGPTVTGTGRPVSTVYQFRRRYTSPPEGSTPVAVTTTRSLTTVTGSSSTGRSAAATCSGDP